MTLLYERARYTEALLLPGGVIRLMQLITAMLALGTGIAVLMLIRPFRLHSLVFLPMLIPTTLCAALVTARGLVVVYPDRLEVALTVFGRVWKRYRFVWQTVKSIDLQPTPLLGYSVLKWSPGITIIMFGKRGIRVNLTNGDEVLIGSGDPQKLLSAIGHARRASD